MWNLIANKTKNKKCIFLNTRNDRRYRTIQLINLIYSELKPERLIIRGDNINVLIKDFSNSKIKVKTFNMSATQNDIIDHMIKMNDYFIVGIGNIVGWGDVFLKKMKKYRTKDQYV